MKFRVKNLPIGTGGSPLIALINHEDAVQYDLHHADRLRIKKGRFEATAIIDITDSHEMLLPGQIGLFQDVTKKIKSKDDDLVDIHIQQKPKSIEFIKKKMKGEEIKPDEMKHIVNDIVEGRLTEVEMAYFVASTYMHELSNKEIVALTKSIINSGETLKLRNKVVVDKHCIGGVAGNRTTMVVVPIVAAAGLKMPKTSSRAITSAAGTSDTVEVLCDVSFPIEKMEEIVKNVGGCLMWGGAMNLAPADDKIIKVEHPMSLDPVGQLLASILAKKKSVSATHVLIDIPLGKGCKTEKKSRAELLKKKFELIGKQIGMKVMVVITDGSQPIGNGVGPVLEARDVLWTLRNSEKAPQDLKDKSITLAGHILELAGKAKKGQGWRIAKDILESGKALKKFDEIIEAQNAKIAYPEQLKMAKYSKVMKAEKAGRVKHIDNHGTNRVARYAGAPHDQEAGVYLHVKKGSAIKKGDSLMTIYADSRERLRYATEAYECYTPVIIDGKGKIAVPEKPERGTIRNKIKAKLK